MLDELGCGLWVAERQEVRNRIINHPYPVDLITKQSHCLVVLPRQANSVPWIGTKSLRPVGQFVCYFFWRHASLDVSGPRGVTVNHDQVGKIANMGSVIPPPCLRVGG